MPDLRCGNSLTLPWGGRRINIPPVLNLVRCFPGFSPPMRTIALLTISNVFMTFAWYGHLKFKASPLWIAILASWLIAFVEYCFQVPANRFGHYQFSAAQLKVMQEVITLVVFGVFSVLYLREEFHWNYLVSFALILGAVVCMFGFRTERIASPENPSGAVSTAAAEISASEIATKQ